MEPAISRRPGERPAADYGRTRWSIVRAAASGGEEAARRSLAELCRRYWVPVYVYVRHCGHGPPEAAALTQAFLGWLLERLREEGVDAEPGFRRYLQRRLQDFLADDQRRCVQAPVAAEFTPPWPAEEIERRQRQVRSPESSPSRAFQRAFAFEILGMALDQVREEALQAGRGELFQAARPFLTREPVPGEMAELSRRLACAPLALLIAVRRLRQRFQELVDEQLLETLDDAGDLESERTALLALAAGTTG